MDRCLFRFRSLCQILLLMIATAIAVGAQTTINVPADQPTIQAAINAANPGDTVLVASGTYYENINFLGKAITVASSGGAQSTIIDGSMNGPVVQFVTGEPQAAVLDGFTLTHASNPFFGVPNASGAVMFSNSAATLRNNIVTENHDCDLSGVYSMNSAPQILNNTISNNGQLTSGCPSMGYGAGISIQYALTAGQTRIVGNTIINNVMTAGSGGGISAFQAGNADIRNNLVKRNSAAQNGGVEIWNYSAETVVNNVIVENLAVGEPLYPNGPTAVTQLYIAGIPNQPGMYVINNTLAGGSQDAAVLYLDMYFDAVHLINNIVAGNGTVAPAYCEQIYGSGPPTFANNDVYSAGSATLYSGVCTDQTGVNGNLSVDPAFLDPAHSDYHLQARSPLIDVGNNTAFTLPDKDFDGNQRVVDGNSDGVAGVDIGAYEYVPGPPTPYAALSPESAKFGNQDIDTTSAPIVFTLTNTGTADLFIAGIGITIPFAQTNTCPSTLPAGASCAINVTFTPTAGGTASGTMEIGNNGPKGALFASLTGTGNGISADLSPGYLDFGVVDTRTSTYRTLTLTNTGTLPIVFNGIDVPSPFAISASACATPMSTLAPGTSIAPGTSCTISIQFSPSDPIQYNRVVTVSTTAPQSLTATLNGWGAAPIVGFSPSNLSFGSQLAGTTSSAQTITLSNTGNLSLTISQISITAPFVQSNNCGNSVAPGANCTFSVTYSPSVRGQSSGSLVISSMGLNTSPFTVSLTGTGIAPVLSISPTSLQFSQQLVGTNSAPQSFTVSNAGDSALSIAGFTINAPFTQNNNCPASLAAGSSCSVNVVFSPTSNGSIAAGVTVNVASPATSQSVSLTGSGMAPVLSVSPTAVNFGTIAVSSSGQQQIRIANTGSAPLILGNISTSGGDFAVQTTTCGSSLSPGIYCVVYVNYTPSAATVSNGYLTFTQNDSTKPSPFQIPLTGTGAFPTGTFSAPSLDFGNVLIGSTSGVRWVTLTNTGNVPITIGIPSVTSPFLIQHSTGNCAGSVPVGTSCTVYVQFSPSVTGAATGSLDFGTNIPGGLTSVRLSGTGTAPVLSLSATSVNIGSQLVGTTSAAQVITVSNTGNAPLGFNRISVPAPFAQTNTCGTSLAAGSNCAINVTFTPGSRGAASANLEIIVANPATSQSLAISGTGIAPIMGVSAPSLTFWSQVVGTTSAVQTVWIFNNGDAPLSFTTISAPALFAQTNNCGTSLAAGASCTMNITFSPTARGAASGNLTINVASPETWRIVALSGTGIAPVMSASPAPLTFSPQVVGTTSAGQAVIVSNTGDAALSFGAISVTPPFAQTNNCGASLAAGATCTINVTFAPTSRGAAPGSMTVNVGAPAANQTVALSGTGIAPVASLSSTSWTFALQRVGSASPSQVVTLSNTGDTALTISSVAASGSSFSQTNNCPGTLAAGTSCWVHIAFQPTQNGLSQGSVVITDNSGAVSGSTQTVSLSGTGGASTANVSPANLTFPTTKVGTSAVPMSVSISNGGAMSLNMSSMSASGDFSQSNNCGAVVAPGASCVVNVVFTPTASGSRNGALTINDDAQSGSVQTVSLSGTGAVPTASVAPGTLTLGTLPAGTQSTSSSVTLSNTGVVAMNIASIATTGDFVQTNNCATTLAASSSCTISVIFAPSAGGTRSGLLTVTDDASGGTQTVSLSGSATDFSVTVSPTSVSINPGQSANYNAKVGAVGGVYNQSVSLTCTGLPAAATCTLTPVSVIPGSSSQTAKLKITTSNGGTPSGTYTIVVSGVVNNVIRSATATLIVK